MSVVSSQATSFIADGDRFLFIAFSNKILRVDTETFELTDEQVPLLEGDEDAGVADVGGDVTGLAIRSGTLFATQSDGDLLTIDLSDLTAEPSVTHVIDGSFGDLVVDTEADAAANTLFALNPSGNSVVIFNTEDNSNVSVPFVDGVGSPVAPQAIAFVPLTGTDKIYVTSARGLIFVLLEGATSISGTITVDAAASHDLPAAAVTPDGDFLLVLDATDKVVRVYDTATDTEVDTDPLDAGVNPIPLDGNSVLSDIVITQVARPDDVYAYVSGSSGLSVIDLNLTLAGFGTPTVLDPITLSSTPKGLVASSVADGYLYSSNSNASISVVTDKPFVSIRDPLPADRILSTDGVFNITFQTDETGTFSVMVEGSNAEVASGVVETAGVDVITSDIAFDSSTFAEGKNRVFVFVTADDGLVGRDAIDMTVDTPPPGIEVLSTGFGDQKIFVTISRLTADDIDHYNLYVDTDSSAVATKAAADGTLDQPDSGDEVKAKIVGLDNGVRYFVGIEAVDASGNVGTRTTTFPDGTPVSATPEETFGLAQAAGEGGCSLIHERP